MALSECPECSRHVRLGTRVCPFCDHALPATFGRSRAGALLVGAAAITAMTGCSRIVATKYGGPPPPPPQPSDGVDATDPPDELAPEGEEAAAEEDGGAEEGEEAATEPEAP